MSAFVIWPLVPFGTMDDAYLDAMHLPPRLVAGLRAAGNALPGDATVADLMPQNPENYTRQELLEQVSFLTGLCRQLLREREADLPAVGPSLLESLDGMILLIDSYGRVCLANEAFRAYGAEAWGQAVIPGAKLYELVPAAERAKWEAWIAAALAGESQRETVSVQVAGQVLFYDFAWRPMTAAGIQGAFLAAHDVTQQYLTLVQLREKEQMLSSINFSIREGIFRSSPGQGILYVNQAFVDMFGYESVEEVLALEPYALYVHPERRDDFVRIMQRQTTFHNEEVCFRRKDGKTFWGLMSSIKVEDGGKTYFDGAIRDVTALKEAEDRLRANYEELKKVNQELDLFVHSTSHDLRAPLMTIQGLIALVRETSEPEGRRRYLDLMDQSAHKLDTFIKEIIHYSYNARLERRRESIDFRATVAGCLDELKGIPSFGRLRVRLLYEEGPVFFSDPVRIHMIFFNLLANAVWYQDFNKVLSTLDIRIIVSAKEAFIELKDNGIGIGEDHLDKIFNMFYRGTRQSAGSGVGLYIVREAVHKLEGSVAVSSVAGEGTTLRMHLPQLST